MQFDQATQMLNNDLGGAARAAASILFNQIDGPRSVPVALKLQF